MSATHAATAADRIAFLRGLRAVRDFRPDPVPDAALADILEVARWSGSASNRQPWAFVVVRDRATLRALAAAEGYAAHLAGAALGIVLVMAGKNHEQETYDEGRLGERIMLAAAAHGIGSSIGWLRGTGPDTVKNLLAIPPDRTVRTVISAGYTDDEARRARGPRPDARKPLSELVHDERFGA